MSGYNCELCGNRGYTEATKGEYRVAVICKCKAVRESIRRIDASGLSNLLEECTFDRYETLEGWQRTAKEKAQRFLTDNKGKWFGCFGQIGAGKTHLCTAICGEFLKAGKPVRYMPWRDEIVLLKAMVTDEEEYSDTMNGFKKVDVLYIDDLFWTRKGAAPTPADANIAFELLNYRYNNKGLATILSSQKMIEDIMDIDEAVGSRIYQRCKEYCINIGYDTKKNWRLKA